MNRTRLIVAGCFGVVSLVAAVIATSSTYWFQLLTAEVRNSSLLPGFAQDDPYPFPFHTGLFLTCYDNEIPPTAGYVKWYWFIQFVIYNWFAISIYSDNNLWISDDPVSAILSGYYYYLESQIYWYPCSIYYVCRLYLDLVKSHRNCSHCSHKVGSAACKNSNGEFSLWFIYGPIRYSLPR